MWIISLILFILGALSLIVFFCGKNNSYIDIRHIINDYFKIFQHSRIQLAALYLSPLLISVATALLKKIDKEIISNINIVLSIIISILFAVMGIICSIPKQSNNNYNVLLSETGNVTLFECVISIIALVASFIILFVDVSDGWIGMLISISIYYLVLIVILNIFIVMKRLKALLDNKQQ